MRAARLCLLATGCLLALGCGSEQGPVSIEYNPDGQGGSIGDAAADDGGPDIAATGSDGAATVADGGSDEDAGAATGPIACATDKTCFATGQICDKAAGVCVDCLEDADCDAGKECRAKLCKDPPTPCKSSKECAGQGKICAKKQGVCLDCEEDTDCAADKHCNEGVCVADICGTNDRKCASTKQLLTCSSNGSAWLKSDCGDGFVCVDKSCKPMICEPDEKVCQANSVVTCGPLGRSKSKAVPCPDKHNCVAGKCIPGICKPGAQTCGGKTKALTCNKDGTKWLETACKIAAAGQAEVCLSHEGKAKCVQQVCVPDKYWCEGPSVLLCDAEGVSKKVAMDCTVGGTKVATCVGGKCVDKVCSAGDKSCDPAGGGLRVCAAGLPHDMPSAACPVGEVCVGGGCKAKICTPKQLFCVGKNVRECDATGTSAKDIWVCDAAKVCLSGACVAKVCEPGKSTCDAGKLKTCKDGSKWQTTACPVDTECKDGKCVTSMCAGAITAIKSAGQADIIWWVDTSGSMSSEAHWVSNSLGTFAGYLAAAGLDYRIVLVGKGTGSVHLNAKLGTHLTAANFLWVKKPIYSTDGLKKLVNAPALIDDFDQFLRVKSAKHFVAVTDDDSTQMSWLQFTAKLQHFKHPTQPNGDPLFKEYTWHSIVAYGNTPQKGCATGARIGHQYIALSNKTKGGVYKICDKDWKPFFSDIANKVKAKTASTPGCSFTLPPGVKGDQKKIDGLVLTHTAAGKVTPLIKVATKSICGSSYGFFLVPQAAGAQAIELCPTACTMIDKSTLKASFPCK